MYGEFNGTITFDLKWLWKIKYIEALCLVKEAG